MAKCKDKSSLPRARTERGEAHVRQTLLQQSSVRKVLGPRGQCAKKGRTQGRGDQAGCTQPDKPDGHDKSGRELLSSVKYSRAGGRGEGRAGMLICVSLDQRAGVEIEPSVPRKQGRGLAPLKRRLPPQRPKQQELLLQRHRTRKDPPQSHVGGPPSVPSEVLASASSMPIVQMGKLRRRGQRWHPCGTEQNFTS